MSDKISIQKKKIEQKKARLQHQETMLKLKERKARVKNLINIGGIAAKAEIDHLPSEVFLGACVYIKELIKKDESIIKEWQKKGEKIYKSETNNKTAVILTLQTKITQENRNMIRSHGLRWNTLRKEWYGYVTDAEKLKEDLTGIDYKIDTLK